jgi:hypothetical protein
VHHLGHRFHVIGVGKKVNGLDPHELISLAGERGEIARERWRLARDIQDLFRSQRGKVIL